MGSVRAHSIDETILTGQGDATVRGDVAARLLELDSDGAGGRIGPLNGCGLACGHFESALAFWDAYSILLC